MFGEAGEIAEGMRNLHGERQQRGFELSTQVGISPGTRDGAKAAVVPHDDVVPQGPSEELQMPEVVHRDPIAVVPWAGERQRSPNGQRGTPGASR